MSSPRIDGGSGAPADRPAGGRAQTVVHHGPPLSIQAVDVARLVSAAWQSGAVIEMAAAIGDPVAEAIPVFTCTAPGTRSTNPC